MLCRRVDVVIESSRWCFGRLVAPCYATVMLLLATFCLRADQVEMQNGGVTGRNQPVSLPRSQVALITLGSSGATNFTGAASAAKRQSAASSIAITNGMTDLSVPLRQLGANTNFIEQVRRQFLSDAGPEANNKFNTLVSGLLSGRLTVNDIRAEAKAAADQLKELKRDLGEDASGALDGYLAILESFLRETAPSPGVSATNISRPLPKAKPEPVRKEE